MNRELKDATSVGLERRNLALVKQQTLTKAQDCYWWLWQLQRLPIHILRLCVKEYDTPLEENGNAI